LKEEDLRKRRRNLEEARKREKAVRNPYSE